MSLLARYPFAMSVCVIGPTRGFLGDGMAQTLDREDGESFELDLGRSATYAAWGCASCALYDYLFYVRIAPRVWPTYAAGVFSRSNVFKAVMLDALVLMPLVYFPALYLYKDAVLAGKPAHDALRRYEAEAVVQNGIGLGFWLPINFFMFALVKPELRVPFTSAAALGYAGILSWVSEGLCLNPVERRLARRSTRAAQ